MPPLSVEEQQLLQTSWNRLQGKEMDFVTHFYAELFKEYPDYKELFSKDIGQQKLKFIEMMNIIINGILYIEPLLPTIKLLGKQHDDLGIQPSDYDKVATTFVRTLEKSLDEISPLEIEQWSKALNFLKEQMLDFD